MPTSLRHRIRMKAPWLGRFAGDERATTAIEFGILAVPFFAIIGAILETAVVFLASQALDNAVQDASRTIATGQAQAQGFDYARFNQQICDELYNMFDCTKLQIRVEPVGSFTQAALPPDPPDPNDPDKWKAFLPGGGSQVIMVQVYYKWPTILNLGGFNLATSSDGSRLLGAVRVFANEPFTS